MVSTTTLIGRSQWRNHYDKHINVVDTIRVASMDETDVTYVDDERVDNHDSVSYTHLTLPTKA